MKAVVRGSSKLSNFKFLRFPQKKNTRVILGCVLLVTVTGALFLLHNSQQHQKRIVVKCEAVVTKANNYMNRQDNASAYNLLKGAQKNCNQYKNLSVQVIFNAQLAITTYTKGDKVVAKSYADNVLSQIKNLSSIQREKIVNYESFVFYMKDIKTGTYDGVGGLY